MDVFELVSTSYPRSNSSWWMLADMEAVMAEGMGEDVWTLSSQQNTNVVKVSHALLW